MLSAFNRKNYFCIFAGIFCTFDFDQKHIISRKGYMEGNYDYDVVIIGAGPGGYVSAIRASQLGLKAAVIEKDRPGGVCLNMGCIPSKALIHQAEVFRSIDDLRKMGVEVDTSKFDYGVVYKKSRKAADMLSKGVNFLLKKNNVDLIEGTAVLKSPHEVSMDDGRTVSGENILIAAGSSPRVIPGFEFDGDRVLSSDDALMLQELPEKLLILGAGAIGVEFAHIMNAFGVEVHLVELMDHIIPLEDAELAAVLDRSFKKRGIKIYTSTKALWAKLSGAGAVAQLEAADGKKMEIEADKVLVVIGRAPNTQGLGLENVGIETEKGFIPVGDYYQTKIGSIYAVGDVVASPLLAHVASKEGEITIEHLAGKNPVPRIVKEEIPSAIYCEPQIASFGYSETRASEEGIPFKKAVFPYRGAGKAVAVEKSEGMVKVLYDPETSEIIGAHVAGTDATEIIHEILLAKSSELLPANIAGMVHAHPTISEAVMEAMRVAEGWAIHI